MTFTLSLGWWIIPAAITFVAFGIAYLWSRPDGKAYGYGAIGQGVVELFGYGVATVVSLIAWLIFALVF